MAEVLPPLTSDNRLVHSNDVNTAPNSSAGSSLWANSSWFAAPPAPCPNSRPRQELPTSAASLPPPQTRSAGGAAAQCRFSGRCAVPIATTAPVDGSPLPAAVGAVASAAWQPPGMTCDGSKSEAQAARGRGFMSAWRFDMDRWTWVPRDGGAAAAGQPTAKHELAARRWGDGRDALPAAAQQAQQSTPAGRSAASATSQPASAAAQAKATAAAETTGFASVGGLWRQKEGLRNAVVLPLRHPRLFAVLGTQALRGVLLHGPPGTGKTFLVPVLAAEARAHLEVVDGAEVAAGSEAAKRLKQAFRRAKANAPAVLFIDSLDALAPARQPGAAAADDQQGAFHLASLLDELLSSGAAVAVVAAAGQRSHVCPALLRPGRLGVEVPFGLPSAAERAEVLESLTRHMPLAGVSIADLSDRMRGFVPADCAAVCADAASACVAEAVAAAEAEAALQRVPPEALEQQLLGSRLRIGQSHFAAALDAAVPSSLRGVMLPEVPQVAWSDIGGYEDVKRALREMIEVPLSRPALMKAFGATPARGALLYGPPGCGKTLLAQAAAAQCGANFIAVRGPELLDKWFGESERAVRELFATALAAAPCIIVVDEVDSLAAKRGDIGSAVGDGAAARVLTQLLAEMDGIAARPQTVFVLGATNRPDAMDPALLRPGRLDVLIEVPLPDEAARAAILQTCLRRAPLAAGLDIEKLAALTAGFSGADLAEVCRRASQLAMREYLQDGEAGTAVVAVRHFEDALGSARHSAMLGAARCSSNAAAQPMHKVAPSDGMDIDGAAVSGAAGASAAAAGSKQAADARQAAWIRAMAARAADDVRAHMAGGGETHFEQLTAYVRRLESVLQAVGIPLPAS